MQKWESSPSLTFIPTRKVSAVPTLISTFKELFHSGLSYDGDSIFLLFFVWTNLRPPGILRLCSHSLTLPPSLCSGGAPSLSGLSVLFNAMWWETHFYYCFKHLQIIFHYGTWSWLRLLLVHIKWKNSPLQSDLQVESGLSRDTLK